MGDIEKTLLREPRVVRGTLRSVWLDSGKIVKEYKTIRWPGDTRRPWRCDHDSLCRLNAYGVAAPISYDLSHAPQGVVTHRREFVAGAPFSESHADKTDALAAHLRDVHAAGVINCDISPGNILIACDGRLMLIDYGRSRIISRKGFLFHWYVGKELARTRRRVFPGMHGKWLQLCRRYYKLAGYPSWGLATSKTSIRFWCRQWKINAC